MKHKVSFKNLITLALLTIISLVVIIIILKITVLVNNKSRIQQYVKAETTYVATDNLVVAPNLFSALTPNSARIRVYSKTGEVVKEYSMPTLTNSVYNDDKQMIYYQTINGFEIFDIGKWQVRERITYKDLVFYDKLGNNSVVQKLLILDGKIYFAKTQDRTSVNAKQICSATTQKCYIAEEKIVSAITAGDKIAILTKSKVITLNQDLSIDKSVELDIDAETSSLAFYRDELVLIANKKSSKLKTFVLEAELIEQKLLSNQVKPITVNEKLYLVVNHYDNKIPSDSKIVIYRMTDTQENLEVIATINRFIVENDNIFAKDNKIKITGSVYGAQEVEGGSCDTRNFIEYDTESGQITENQVKFKRIDGKSIGSNFISLD